MKTNMMALKTLVSGMSIVCIISSVRGGTLATENSPMKGTVRDLVKDILKESTGGGNGDILRALAGIADLKNKTNLLEQRVQSLEHTNVEKEQVIQSLQMHVQEFYHLRDESGQVAAGNDAFDSASVNIADDSVVIPTRQTPAPTIPNIAFSAYLEGTQSNLAPGQTIKFNRVYINEGHGYNPYDGVFAVPISGTYMFTFNIDSRVHTFVRLNVDGVNVVDAVANPHSTSTSNRESMAGNTVIRHVGIGQAVSLEVFDGSGEVASSNKYRLSTFSGFLLHPE